MNKAQKMISTFLILSVLVIGILFGVYFYKLKNSETCKAYKISDEDAGSLPADIIFYYSTTCPHCKIVEEFMQNNSIESKMNIIQKEIFLNKTAADEMIKLQTLCKIPAEYIGAVPLLYAEKSCYLGDKDIICILKEKILEKNA